MSAMELPANIGKYELQELLGGGMARVYRARDTLLGRTVAVKVLTEAACEDAEAKARFLREARVAGNVSHPNIISVYDFGEEQGRPFMVMEFLQGEDLRTLIKNGRTGDIAQRLAIALQIGRAIEHIHSLKIIHRDVKPENIQVTPAGAVKLMDFGIAKLEDSALTRPGFTLGTPYYMAPEQVRGQTLTHLVDIYAFGVLLFELMTGARPIEGDTIERIFYEILVKPLDLKPLDQSGTPPPITDLIVRCTAKNAAERPPGFAEVCGQLEAILRRLSGAPDVEPAPAAAPAPIVIPPPAEAASTAVQNNRVLIAIGLAGLAMLAVAVWLYFAGPR